MCTKPEMSNRVGYSDLSSTFEVKVIKNGAN